MGIVLKWPSQTAKGIEAIEIYRLAGQVAVLNRNALPAPLVTLGPDATRYEDTSVAKNTVYSYWVASVKNGERVFGSRLIEAYYLDVGPGPTDIKFGTWWEGYFGPVEVSELLTHLEINGQLGITAAQYTPAQYHKFMFRGRILFIPETRTASMTYNQQYNSGLVFGTDDGGAVPTGSVSRNQRRTVQKNGREFVIRFPYNAAYTIKQASGLNAANYLAEGEWLNTMVRLLLINNGGEKWGDIALADTAASLNGLGSTMFAQQYGVSVCYFVYGTAPQNVSTLNVSSAASIFHVLELVIP